MQQHLAVIGAREAEAALPVIVVRTRTTSSKARAGGPYALQPAKDDFERISIVGTHFADLSRASSAAA
jgi:hypothetical protein